MSVNHHLMWARLCIFNPPPHSCRPLPVSTFGCREQEGPKPTTVSAQKGTTYILQSMCLTSYNSEPEIMLVNTQLHKYST